MNRYKEWIKRAKSDYKFSCIPIEDDMYYEDACFHAQQTVEKAFKGLLLYYGFETSFTHDISLLIKELKKYTDVPTKLNKSIELTKYAHKTRYPGNYKDIPEEEYKRMIEIARDCLVWVESKITE